MDVSRGALCNGYDGGNITLINMGGNKDRESCKSWSESGPVSVPSRIREIVCGSANSTGISNVNVFKLSDRRLETHSG